MLAALAMPPDGRLGLSVSASDPVITLNLPAEMESKTRCDFIVIGGVSYPVKLKFDLMPAPVPK